MNAAPTKEELKFFPSWAAGRPGYADRIRQIFQEYHQKKGMRMTQQRNHVGMEEIYRALKGHGVGRVTVFRALKMLEECKLVDRVSSSDGKPRFEVKYERPHHDHLICIDCGAIREIQWPQIEKIQEKTCRDMGFETLFHRHEVFGRCASCQKKMR
jgi:Fur family transcriptional regulator, ferric uptake regulator